MFTVKSVPSAWMELTSRVMGRTHSDSDLEQSSGTEADLGSGVPSRRPAVPGRVEVVRIRMRRLDGSTCLTIRPQLSAAWNRGASTVVIDMSNVVFLDSLGISALIAEQRRKPRGTRIVVSSLNEFVRDVFEVTQLFQIFDVYSSSEAAVSTLAA